MTKNIIKIINEVLAAAMKWILYSIIQVKLHDQSHILRKGLEKNLAFCHWAEGGSHGGRWRKPEHGRTRPGPPWWARSRTAPESRRHGAAASDRGETPPAHRTGLLVRSSGRYCTLNRTSVLILDLRNPPLLLRKGAVDLLPWRAVECI